MHTVGHHGFSGPFGYRTDFEKRDDVNFLSHTLAYRSETPGAPELRYKPVVITEFEPKERKY